MAWLVHCWTLNSVAQQVATNCKKVSPKTLCKLLQQQQQPSPPPLQRMMWFLLFWHQLSPHHTVSSFGILHIQYQPSPESAACSVGKPCRWSKPAKPITLTLYHIHICICTLNLYVFTCTHPTFACEFVHIKHGLAHLTHHTHKLMHSTCHTHAHSQPFTYPFQLYHMVECVTDCTATTHPLTFVALQPLTAVEGWKDFTDMAWTFCVDVGDNFHIHF